MVNLKDETQFFFLPPMTPRAGTFLEEAIRYEGPPETPTGIIDSIWAVSQIHFFFQLPAINC